MKIIIAGCGNVGITLTEQLSKENHDVVVIDNREQIVENISNAYDVLGVVGNCTSFNVLMEAGVSDADLLIAVTGYDELNLLCCLMAKKAGGCNTIARVSNPTYSNEIGFIKEELGISMIINPQLAASQEMAQILKFPSALNVDSFAKSRAELVNYRLEEGNPLCNKKLKELDGKVYNQLLIATVERNDEVIIPNGDFELKAKDIITIVGNSASMLEFFKKIGVPTSAAKNVLIVGGGRTTIYLAKQLIDMGIKVRIIEKDEEICERLADMLPKAMIINGDATDKELLLEEGLKETEAFITNTDFDEENIMLALYAKSVSNAKLITKIHRISYDEIIDNLDIGSIIYPKHIMAEAIIKYVRAMKNSLGSNIETLYRINDNRVEAMEFLIKEDSPIINVPLQNLKLKPNVLIGCISRKGKVIVPNGQSTIDAGDRIIVITTNTGFQDVEDALK